MTPQAKALSSWMTETIVTLGLLEANRVLLEAMHRMYLDGKEGATAGEWRAMIMKVASEYYPTVKLDLALPRYN